MATFTSTFPVALLENCQSTLKIFRRDNRFPVSSDGLWGYFSRTTGHPSSIRPVVEDCRKRTGIRDPFAMLLDVNKWTPASIRVPFGVEGLTNLLQRQLVLQQQIPSIAPK
ncbi:MAG: hypothetical protein IPM16_04695 [Chloroflexi bacterium]|nr:hypothetical protein [Chloroflexota bacterium]